MNPRPEAVVFDIGMVLLTWDPHAYYAARIGHERARAFFETVPIEALNERSDMGEPLDALIDGLARAMPGWEREIRLWWDEWLQICTPAIAGSVALLDELKFRGVPLFTLTNFGDATFEMARAAYPFLDLFDAHFVSARLNAVKPDPAIYAALETGTGYSGAELIFADDRAENIAAAAARGWQVHHFRRPEEWRTALVSAGLLG